MNTPRVLLADDHRIVLEGLRRLLAPDFEIIGTVEDGISLVLEADRLRPDLVVADISMPKLGGIDAARRIKEFDQAIRIVFLTMHTDPGYAASALEAGALGFVLKHAALRELTRALREAMLGRIYVSPAFRAGDRKDSGLNVSPRQQEVLQLLVEGKSAKEIASVLEISPRTVEFHKYRMMDLLNIKTSAELIRYAVRCDLTA